MISRSKTLNHPFIKLILKEMWNYVKGLAQEQCGCFDCRRKQCPSP